MVRVERISHGLPMLVTFESFSYPQVPVRVENWCEDVVLRIGQQNSNQVTKWGEIKLGNEIDRAQTM